MREQEIWRINTVWKFSFFFISSHWYTTHSHIHKHNTYNGTLYGYCLNSTSKIALLVSRNCFMCVYACAMQLSCYTLAIPRFEFSHMHPFLARERRAKWCCFRLCCKICMCTAKRLYVSNRCWMHEECWQLENRLCLGKNTQRGIFATNHYETRAIYTRIHGQMHEL